MKKILLPLFAAALSLSASAQSSPFEWQVSDNTKIKLGGYVRFNINSDFDGSVGGGNDFVSTNIQESSWNNESNLGFDPSATRFSLQITQSTEALGDVKVFVETDFRGSSVRLRQAYVEAKGFIAGQAWSFMTDMAANAPTVDINGVGSRTFQRTQLFGYRHNFSDVLSAGISLEYPSFKSLYATDFTSVNQTVPNIPVYLQLKSAAGHLKAGAMFNTLQYGDSNNQERLSEMGIGGQLSGSLRATKAITLYGQAIYGKGISNYISNLASLSTGVSLMSVDGTEMEATPMGGYSAGVGAKLSKKWSAAVSGSLVENYGDKDFFDGYFQKSTYISTAFFYVPAPKVTLGLEYLNGSLTNFGSDAIGAQRLSFSVKYSL